MMLVNFVRMQIFSLHGIRFGRKAFYYKPETEIDRDDRYGSTCELKQSACWNTSAIIT